MPVPVTDSCKCRNCKKPPTWSEAMHDISYLQTFEDTVKTYLLDHTASPVLDDPSTDMVRNLRPLVLEMVSVLANNMSNAEARNLIVSLEKLLAIKQTGECV